MNKIITILAQLILIAEAAAIAFLMAAWVRDRRAKDGN